MATIALKHVSKIFDSAGEPAVDDVTLEIQDGEFFVLLGPSGCGKSTLLRMIGGLEEATDGEIWLDDRLVNYDAPGRRNVAMVFQNYALYPHLTVRRNIAFPLRMQKVQKVEQRERAERAAAMLGISDLMDRRVAELSGGQRQRVAVGRAIIRRPAALLMDEPLSNLDALLRVQTREQLMHLHREIKATVVYVTHDQVEAMTMGDRIGVMRAGDLVQVGAPREIYERPADRFVAGFIGNPPMNFLEGVVAETPDGPTFISDDLRVPLDANAAIDYGRVSQEAVALGVRPEAIRAVSDREGPWTVDLVEDHGADQIMLMANGSHHLRVRASEALEAGNRSALTFASNSVQFFDQEGRALR